MSGSSDEEESWIEWFCGLTGHEYFCEVDRSYIEDSFNLYGLRSFIPNYQASLDTILDVSADLGEGSQAEEEAPTYAKVLYGMIHARYILTTRGLEAMVNRFPLMASSNEIHRLVNFKMMNLVYARGPFVESRVLFRYETNMILK